MNIKQLAGPKSNEQYKNLTYFRRGGMGGEIYLADDVVDNRKVAIKIIQIDYDDDRELLLQEFKIALGLKNINIIETFYYSQVQVSNENYFYASMEYVSGGNFRDLLKSQTSYFEINVAINFMLQIAHGLQYAHDFAIHRDLKPENILVDNNRLLICDFGLSKYVDSKTRSRTFKGAGTIPYMAPETWTFDANSKAMDMYSLGIIFFEILTLTWPFPGPSENDFKSQHLFNSLPSIRKIRSDIPLRLEEMINRLCNKRPSERYKNVAEVVHVLESCISDNPSKSNEPSLGILLKAQQKISDINQQKLDLEKKQKIASEKIEYLNFSINALFEKYISRIDELNAELEREKIQYNKSGRSLYITFLNKSASISFYASDYITEYIETKRKKFYEFQKAQHGFIIQEHTKTSVETDNLMVVGKAEILSNTGHPWGYNLLLKKESEADLYGFWDVVWFNDSAFAKNYRTEQYAIPLPQFFDEYGFGRGHVMNVRSMSMTRFDQDMVDKLVEKLFE
jgi:serine/threonine protein kinase